MVTVSGIVTHGRGIAGNPPTTTNRNPEGHPRVFSQTFLLVPDTEATAATPNQPAKYYVSADTLRFVG
jgi:NTF2-related export protein 1/2